MTLRALFLSRDPGSLRAILPVARSLRERGGWDIVAAALPGQEAAFADALGEAPIALGSDLQGDDALARLDALLAHHASDIVISGSSPANRVGLKTPEKWLVVAARQHGVPSVGVLDFWGFYYERFFGADGQLDLTIVPDHLCVLDALCHNDLVSLGISPQRMTVTHNPALDALVAEVAARPPPAPELMPDRRRLIFASQPLAEHAAARGWTVTQYELFDALLAALPANQRWQVIVWTHPAESEASWARHQSQMRSDEHLVVTLGVDRGAAVLLHVDLLVTSHSSTAYRAALSGTPIVSFRPFAWARELPVVDRLNLAQVVRDRAALSAVFAGFDAQAARAEATERLERLARRGMLASDGAATLRVVDLIGSVCCL